MDLIMDYKEGTLMNEGNRLYLVLFKTLYNIVIVEFNRNLLVEPYSEWGNNLPIFSWKNYNLTNRDDVNELNAKFVVTSTNNLNKFPEVYGVEMGSIVEYNYKQYVLVGQTDRKILSYTLKRPILFDFNKAKEKYIVFDRLDKLNELQNEFNSTWSEYFVTPLDSKDNIDWTIVRDKLPFEEVIGKQFIENEFVHTPTEDITLEDFYNVIDTKKLNLISDESIKNGIKDLIKQTLVIAKENGSIGVKSEPKKSVVPKTKKYEVLVRFRQLKKYGGEEFEKTYEVSASDEEDAKKEAENIWNKIDSMSHLEFVSAKVLKEIVDLPKEENITDENKDKTLYKIKVIVKGLDKDGGDEFSSFHDIYADSETEALEKIRQEFKDDEEFRLSDLSYFSDEIVEVIPPNKKEPVLEKPIEETENLEDLLALYKIEETENLDDLLKLYE